MRKKNLLGLLLLTSQFSYAEGTWLPLHATASATGATTNNLQIISGEGLLPLYGDTTQFVFADIMGDYASDDTSLISPGLGYRQLVDTHVVGGYFFVDRERTSLGEDFWVLSPGVEWMSQAWDAHMNAYFPTHKQEQSGELDFASNYGDYGDVAFEEGTHNQYDELVTPYAVIGNGADIELGYRFMAHDNLYNRVYVGSYYYQPPASDDVSNITGFTAGFEKAITEHFTVSLLNSYDNLTHYTAGIGVTMTVGQDPNRLLDPVRRHIGIIDTGAGTYDQQYLKDSGTSSLQYDNVYFISETGSGDGTYGDPAALDQETLDNANEESPDGVRFYVQGGDDAVYYVDEETSTESDGLHPYDNQDFYGRTADYTAPATGDERPQIEADATNNYNAFVIETGENTFSDLNITSGLNGIVVNSSDDVMLTIINTTITGMTLDGLKVTNNSSSDVTVTIESSEFNSNGNGGAQFLNSSTGSITADIENSQFNDNSTSGLQIYNSSTGTSSLTIDSSTFNDNGQQGIQAHNNVGTEILTITNSEFDNNEANGVKIYNFGTGTTTVSITDSMFSDNANSGLFVQNTSSGTIAVDDLSGSSFVDNEDYGIEAIGSASGTTTINDTGTDYSGNISGETNKGSSSYVNWTLP